MIRVSGVWYLSKGVPLRRGYSHKNVDSRLTVALARKIPITRREASVVTVLCLNVLFAFLILVQGAVDAI